MESGVGPEAVGAERNRRGKGPRWKGVCAGKPEGRTSRMRAGQPGLPLRAGEPPAPDLIRGQREGANTAGGKERPEVLLVQAAAGCQERWVRGAVGFPESRYGTKSAHAPQGREPWVQILPHQPTVQTWMHFNLSEPPCPHL